MSILSISVNGPLKQLSRYLLRGVFKNVLLGKFSVIIIQASVAEFILSSIFSVHSSEHILTDAS